MSKFLKIFAPAGAGAASVLTLAYVLADQFVVDLPAPLRDAVAVQPAQAQDSAPAAEPTPVAEAPVVQVAAFTEASVPSNPGGYGLGREAHPAEIAAWDIDVRPDGQGLPAGEGDVWTGEEVFVEKCAVCHGDFGEAVGRWPVLAGGWNTLEDADPVKTIGSYWPYLSTVYDYVNRAMPFGYAQSLEPDEIYAITAYLLYLNNLVEDDFVLNNENFTEVRLPNEDNFYLDDRLETEFPVFVRPEICMENCKETVEITMRATVLDVTPEEDGTEEAAAPAVEEASAAEELLVAEESTETEEAAAAPTAEVAVAAVDPALVEKGEGVFRKCSACHQVGEGATNRSGPQLNGLMGRTIGGVDGFRYSGVFADAQAAGEVWNHENLSAFLADPRGAMSGTKMTFRGLGSQDDIDAVIAYLTSVGGNI